MRAFATTFPATDTSAGSRPLIVGADPALDQVVDRGKPRLRPKDCARQSRDALRQDARSMALVVGERGEAVGVFDALEAFAAGDLEGRRVEDVMTHFVFTLPANGTLSQAAGVMAYEGVDHCAVIDTDGRAVGLVTAADVALWMGRAAGFVGLLDPANPRRHMRAV